MYWWFNEWHLFMHCAFKFVTPIKAFNLSKSFVCLWMCMYSVWSAYVHVYVSLQQTWWTEWRILFFSNEKKKRRRITHTTQPIFQKTRSGLFFFWIIYRKCSCSTYSTNNDFMLKFYANFFVVFFSFSWIWLISSGNLHFDMTCISLNNSCVVL